MRILGMAQSTEGLWRCKWFGGDEMAMGNFYEACLVVVE